MDDSDDETGVTPPAHLMEVIIPRRNREDRELGDAALIWDLQEMGWAQQFEVLGRRERASTARLRIKKIALCIRLKPRYFEPLLIRGRYRLGTLPWHLLPWCQEYLLQHGTPSWFDAMNQTLPKYIIQVAPNLLALHVINYLIETGEQQDWPDSEAAYHMAFDDVSEAIARQFRRRRLPPTIHLFEYLQRLHREAININQAVAEGRFPVLPTEEASEVESQQIDDADDGSQEIHDIGSEEE